jgi:hypothetical protein
MSFVNVGVLLWPLRDSAVRPALTVSNASMPARTAFLIKAPVFARAALPEDVAPRLTEEHARSARLYARGEGKSIKVLRC